MAETLLTLMVGPVVVAALYGAARWAASLERRANDWHLSHRVYYQTRGAKARSQAPLLRQGHAPGSNDAPTDD